MRTAVQQPVNSSGVRPAVWLLALGLVLSCVLVLLLFPRRSRDSIDDIEYAAEHPIASAINISPAKRHSREASPRFTLSAEEAKALACRIANEKARELYGCQPFLGDSPARFVEGCWFWSECRGQGLLDLEANVEFGEDGSTPTANVSIIILDNLR